MAFLNSGNRSVMQGYGGKKASLLTMLGLTRESLPHGWQQVESDNGIYYWNQYTNETTWARPAGDARGEIPQIAENGAAPSVSSGSVPPPPPFDAAGAPDAKKARLSTYIPGSTATVLSGVAWNPELFASAPSQLLNPWATKFEAGTVVAGPPAETLVGWTKRVGTPYSRFAYPPPPSHTAVGWTKRVGSPYVRAAIPPPPAETNVGWTKRVGTPYTPTAIAPPPAHTAVGWTKRVGTPFAPTAFAPPPTETQVGWTKRVGTPYLQTRVAPPPAETSVGWTQNVGNFAPATVIAAPPAQTAATYVSPIVSSGLSVAPPPVETRISHSPALFRSVTPGLTVAGPPAVTSRFSFGGF